MIHYLKNYISNYSRYILSITYKLLYIIFFTSILSFSSAQYNTGEHSVARMWNEALLDAIRSDFARPTVHARNLFHTSVVMYDAWAIYDPIAEPYLLGSPDCDFEGVPPIKKDINKSVNEAISYAAHRLLKHRFSKSASSEESMALFDSLIQHLGYQAIAYPDTSIPYIKPAIDYSYSPSSLGLYIAECMIARGLNDGSNEANDYANQVYEPVNPLLNPLLPGNSSIISPTHWQPLELESYIDQSGNVITSGAVDFLSAEWGKVTPFALTKSNLNILRKFGHEYWVYHDPGIPPYISQYDTGEFIEEYLWNFALVAAWGSHLDPSDGVMIDISPSSIGNVQLAQLPTRYENYRHFYNFLDGGDIGQGHQVNPYTDLPYKTNIVARGDYTRVLAEFWADGPDSETPPGHWFTILNSVSDTQALEKRIGGTGQVVNDLEWDIKAYFALGGAVHDAAVSVWGVKGWYDYIRPISAIRAMTERGQSSDPSQANYSPTGIPLIPGLIEVVKQGDSLAVSDVQAIGKIKLYTWRGPEFIQDPTLDHAGVGWILAENWWPYQRPNFVTPPFAGYVSGHSAFSRAAAEVLTLFTGDKFFPGGMFEFVAPKGDFLVFEEGPTEEIVLQWATYQDASDQTSLSRIWGGIHPPVDDIPGRLIGYEVGVDAFELASQYFGNP